MAILCGICIRRRRQRQWATNSASLQLQPQTQPYQPQFEQPINSQAAYGGQNYGGQYPQGQGNWNGGVNNYGQSAPPPQYG